MDEKLRQEVEQIKEHLGVTYAHMSFKARIGASSLWHFMNNTKGLSDRNIKNLQEVVDFYRPLLKKEKGE